jgi:hypothetical protein
MPWNAGKNVSLRSNPIPKAQHATDYCRNYKQWYFYTTRADTLAPRYKIGPFHAVRHVSFFLIVLTSLAASASARQQKCLIT